MAATPSTMLPLGTKAPDFNLVNTNGDTTSLSDFEEAPALLVVFMCNHCPFVKHLLDELVTFIRTYQDKGLAAVAISSNDVANHPDDSPEQMARLARHKQFSFAYLYDEDQSVAKAYRAACTPDFFLFDRDRALVYRGQFDDSRPGNRKPVTGQDLGQAIDQLLSGQELSKDQKPSIGCNIKWKAGNEPDYY